MKTPLSASFGLLVLLSSTQTLAADTVSSAEKVYVGGYRQGSVDVLSRLVLLDDHTYCFGVTGGSLDLLTAGYWKSNPDKASGISLSEVRASSSLFPVRIKTTKDQGDKVAFVIHGYSMSDARHPVFATSASDSLPTAMRPLFVAGKSNWSDRYNLPPIKSDQARFFYIGHYETDKYRRPTRVKVFQYALGNGNTVLIGYDQNQGRPLMNMTAKLVDNVLHIDGQRFGKKDTLPAEVFSSVREECTKPVFQAAKNEEKKNNDVTPTPIKSFYLDSKAIQGSPWFAKDRD